jgi:K+-sensing histidine kinase KdpD
MDCHQLPREFVMNALHPTDPIPPSRLARFLDRICQVISHDLRTPLGTIVNYASVLEAAQGIELVDVHDLGRRIRRNAQRSANMVQSLVHAIELAGRGLERSPTDLNVLAHSILSDGGGHGDVHVSASSQDARVDVDAEVVGFAWRAYLAAESDAAGKPVGEACLQVRREPDAIVLELQCGSLAQGEAPAWSQAETSDLSRYLRFSQGPARLENSMGLGLAQELVHCHGGELEVFGKPGARSGMRVRLPVPQERQP